MGTAIQQQHERKWSTNADNKSSLTMEEVVLAHATVNELTVKAHFNIFYTSVEHKQKQNHK